MTDARYEFGENWGRFVDGGLDEERIAAAMRELRALAGEVSGLRVVDIGCGSGLHSLAALRLGAARVDAFDYDPQSVAAATRTLSRLAPGGPWSVRRGDVLAEAPPEELYDLVYSWGVLHHTGAMRQAIGRACAFCRPGGLVVLALYVRTPFCPLWRAEKRLYTRCRPLRPLFDALFAGLVLLRRLLAGENPARYLREYKARRGMAFLTDIRDWLGGYPYESVSDQELDALMAGLGFAPAAKRNVAPGLGLLGAGCGEWAYRKL